MAPTEVQVLPVVFFALLFSSVAWGLQCPTRCKCTQDKGKITAHCNGLGGVASRVTSIPEGFPPGVFFASLAHLSIQKLTKSSFRGLEQLSILYLYDNKIDRIDPETFTSLEKLRVLDLSYNKLKTLKVEVLQPLENSLEELYLAENPWDCTCDLHPLKLWLEKIGKVATDRYSITCVTPEALDGRGFLGLSQQDMGCSEVPT
ncbi:leucine-rich repeat-containing protein Bf66946-like [Lissotriton helveticus]